MYSFVALVWDALDQFQTSAAHRISFRIKELRTGFQPVFSSTGLNVFHAGAEPGPNQIYPLSNGTGVVLGTLFRRAESVTSNQLTLDVSASSAILKSRGRYLVENYWGRYLAFIRDDPSNTVWALRDPTGGLPCFFVSLEGPVVFFSWMPDCLSLGHLKLSINWRYVTAFAANPALQIRETGLKEVLEVQPGECIEVQAGARTHSRILWNPAAIARSDQIEDAHAATQEAERTTRMCVGSWAGCYPRILHKLSGGLDSAIVLSCLPRPASGGSAVKCLNYYDLSADGDEREYARLLAGRMGYELIEVERDPAAARLDAVLDFAKSARPWYGGYYAMLGHLERELTRSTDSGALFGGGGGDQLFFYHGTGYAAADYVFLYGIGRRLLGIALDVARTEGRPVWHILRRVLREGLFPRRGNPLARISRHSRFLHPDLVGVATGSDYSIPPWAKNCDLPPGKFQHVLSLSYPQGFYDPLGQPGDAERVEPLASQPLVELFLRIPTHILAANGKDRAVARRAFAEHLPREVISRRTKGGLNSFIVHVIQRNHAFVRELMLDGVLARERILDRRKLEAFFSSGYFSVVPEVIEIVEFHLGLEAWLQDWTGTCSGLQKGPR